MWSRWDFGCPHHHPGHCKMQPVGTSPPLVDLPELALSTWVLNRHPGGPLGQRDRLAPARGFDLLLALLYVCLSLCVMCLCVSKVHMHWVGKNISLATRARVPIFIRISLYLDLLLLLSSKVSLFHVHVV